MLPCICPVIDHRWRPNVVRTKSSTRGDRRVCLEENAEKLESVFVIRSAQRAEKLGSYPEYFRSWKLPPENLRLRSTWRPLDSSFERKGALVTVGNCVPVVGDSSNQFEIVSKIPAPIQLAMSCCEMYFTRCCARWNGLEHSHWKARLCV